MGGTSVLQEWLSGVWGGVQRLAILSGGEGLTPVAEREQLVLIEDKDSISKIRCWATQGDFTGDACRCPGDLTIALLDDAGVVIGAASLHPGNRISWERGRFHSDLVAPGLVYARLMFSQFGLVGASRAVLEQLISLLNLREGEVQFRPAGDTAAMSARKVPIVLFEMLEGCSGEEAAELDQDLIRRMNSRLLLAGGGEDERVRQLLAWLGSATWPAEAISGDGKLARRMLNELDPHLIQRVLCDLTEPVEIMGAVAWAAFRDDDSMVMGAVGAEIGRIIARG
ncbi:hypothetical protein ACN28G_04285 [Micromonospora sp. WMMA1923]|uniref:hypothetical protein n=1 Tax=Micromonospora sp. WMMA1923 TaxID=3404125 RepID=UPI003B94E8AC